MKHCNFYILFILSAFIFNCKQDNKTSQKNLNESYNSNDIDDSLSTPISEEKINKTLSVKEVEPKYYYVSATSGLNYRNAPNGEILGKYPLNTSVKTISHSGIFEDIKDGKNLIKGEWLGVERYKDTVYVFDAFLSESFTYSDIRIYYLSDYTDNDFNSVGQFINLSESFNDHDNKESPLISEEQMGDDIINFSDKKKSQFLKNANIARDDTIYIYDFKLDSVFTYKVSELKLVGTINAYAKGSGNKSIYDYEFGLAITDEEVGFDMNFVHIGKQNIFNKGQLKPMVWDKIDSKEFPIKYDSVNPPTQTIWWTRGLDVIDTFKFSSEGLAYYIQNLVSEENLYYRHLLVRDITTKKNIFDDLFHESEGTSLLPLYTKDQPKEDQYQFTGKLFKDKPAILFGFEGHSFGCPMIRFASYSEPPAISLCDNRH